MKYFLDANDIAQAITEYVAIKYNHPVGTKLRIKISMDNRDKELDCSAIVEVKK